MDKALRELVTAVGGCLLPYLDPVSRNRLRKSARQLVAWREWPGNDATPLDVGQLALLRLLFLQSETRKAARLGQSEATSLLARTAIDTCITAIWCMDQRDSVDRMRHQNAEMFAKMMSYLVDVLASPEFLDSLTDRIRGEETARALPKLNQMAHAIARGTNDRVAVDLYDRFFAPSSTLIAHGGGLALLRHVGKAGGPSIGPSRVWMQRSAVHVADACMAVLAHAVAERVGAERSLYAEYADAHLRRAMPPITSMGGEGTIRNLRFRKLPAAWKTVRQLRIYLCSPEFESASAEERTRRVRPPALELFELFQTEMSDEDLGIFVDELVRRLTASPEDSSHPSR